MLTTIKVDIYLRVMQSKFIVKNKPRNFSNRGDAPDAPVLDPPLLSTRDIHGYIKGF